MTTTAQPGVLADHQIRAMLAVGQISASETVGDGQIQPASLD
ncbi:MAG: dCTP deaminase, partial [bacterium]